jgi:hypothetical protein
MEQAGRLQGERRGLILWLTVREVGAEYSNRDGNRYDPLRFISENAETF